MRRGIATLAGLLAVAGASMATGSTASAAASAGPAADSDYAAASTCSAWAVLRARYVRVGGVDTGAAGGSIQTLKQTCSDPDGPVHRYVGRIIIYQPLAADRRAIARLEINGRDDRYCEVDLNEEMCTTTVVTGWGYSLPVRAFGTMKHNEYGYWKRYAWGETVWAR